MHVPKYSAPPRDPLSIHCRSFLLCLKWSKCVTLYASHILRIMALRGGKYMHVTLQSTIAGGQCGCVYRAYRNELLKILQDPQVFSGLILRPDRTVGFTFFTFSSFYLHNSLYLYTLLLITPGKTCCIVKDLGYHP